MILTIYFAAISVLLCIIEFFLVNKGKTDLAICIPIFVLIQSFSSGSNLALLSLILFLIMLVTRKKVGPTNDEEDK